MFPEAKKLGPQLKYADRHGHRIAVIAGSREFESETCQLKNLATGNSVEAPLTATPLLEEIRGMLSSKGN